MGIHCGLSVSWKNTSLCCSKSWEGTGPPFFTTPLPQTHGSKSINALIISKKVSLWYIFSFFQRGHAIGCRADPKPREPVQRAPVRHQVHDQVQPNSEGQHHQQNKRNQGTPRAKGRSQREGKFLHNLLYGARLYPRVYH